MELKAIPPALHLFPTPLSEVGPFTCLPPEALEALGSLSHFLVENARTSRRLLSALDLGHHLSSCHFEEISAEVDINDAKRILARMEDNPVGLLSEAGAPCIADPGAIVVRAAHELGVCVIPHGGPSAIMIALMSSGIPAQRFTFHGYLSRSRDDRLREIQGIESTAKKDRGAHAFMEAPYRSDACFQDILSICKAHTRLCVAACLERPNQRIATHTIEHWKRNPITIGKEPTIFVLGE